jgi:hypothetical protein
MTVMRALFKNFAVWTFTALLCGTVMPAAAQQACVPETIDKLWNSAQEQGAQVAVASELQKQDEGADPGNLENDASKKSFLPFLRFGLDRLGVLSEDQNAFSVSQKIDIGSSPLEFNIKGKVEEPQIHEALKELLPEDGRQARIDEILADLDESDDFTLTLSSNLRIGNFGRDLDVYGDLFTSLWSSEPIDNALALATAITEITNDPTIPPDLVIDETTDLCSIPNEALRRKLRDKVVRAAQEEAEAKEVLSRRLEETRLSEFYKLVDNQPQLHLTTAYRWRDAVLGPSGLSAKLSYEYGFANVNKFRKAANKDNQITLEDYSDYLSKPRTQAFLEHDDRISGSIEYVDDRKDRILLPDDGIDLTIGNGTSLKLTGTYGRSLRVAPDLRVLSRVDLSASYEDISDDPQRQDRGIASVTYSARVRDPWFFTIVFNYANHAKYLPQSDKDFGAHVGISYNLFSKEDGN